MDMTYLSGRGFTSVTKGEKDENEFWKVVVVMGETISYPNGTSREEHIEAMGIDKNFDKAHQTALKSCLQQLQDYVYSRGFESLIEAMDYMRNLESGDGNNDKPDQDTVN